VNPDVLTLDVEMPEMDGLQTLKALRPKYPHLVVIMFSTLTNRGATATIEALSFGASDYVTKAANVGSLDRSMQALRTELIPKIKQFFHRPGSEQPRAAAPIALPRPVFTAVRPARAAVGPKRLIAIGVSTGGPTALAEVFPQFPKELDVPIVIVQHMPPMFTKLLAERLQQVSKLRVFEAVWPSNRAAPTLHPATTISPCAATALASCAP
jgi:two-component system chemotaxis response regulator CheB